MSGLESSDVVSLRLTAGFVRVSGDQVASVDENYSKFSGGRAKNFTALGLGGDGGGLHYLNVPMEAVIVLCNALQAVNGAVSPFPQVYTEPVMVPAGFSPDKGYALDMSDEGRCSIEAAYRNGDFSFDAERPLLTFDQLESYIVPIV